MTEQKQQSTAKKIGRFIGAVIGAGIFGVFFGFIAALIGVLIMQGRLFGFGGLAGALGGIIIGYPVGVIIGIVVIKRVFHYQGSIWLGIVGVVLGGAITIGLAEPLNLNLNPNVLFTVFFLLVPVLCTAGFRLKKG